MDNLTQELKSIHNLVYKRDPSAELESQYVRVHSVYQKHIQASDQLQISKLIQADVDLISLELFWRFKNKYNLLSQKFQIVFYLTEVKSEYQDQFISSKNDPFAFFKLAFFTVISGLRLVKGFLIYRQIK